MHTLHNPQDELLETNGEAVAPVLIVDDHSLLAGSLAMVLAAEGCAVRTLKATTIDQLVLDGQPMSYLPVFTNIEGTIHVIEPARVSRRPTTFIEMATGDRDLRQRRVRFSTPHRKVGIDIGYDDLRSNGYSFDGRDVLSGTNYGSSATRSQSFKLRGRLDDDQTYAISFRRFESSFQGDLESVTSESRRNGQVGVLDVALGAGRVAVYERGFSTTAQDSITENRTLAVAVTAPMRWLPERWRCLVKNMVTRYAY